MSNNLLLLLLLRVRQPDSTFKASQKGFSQTFKITVMIELLWGKNYIRDSNSRAYKVFEILQCCDDWHKMDFTLAEEKHHFAEECLSFSVYEQDNDPEPASDPVWSQTKSKWCWVANRWASLGSFEVVKHSVTLWDTFCAARKRCWVNVDSQILKK